MLDEMRVRWDAIQHVLALRERWVAVPASEIRAFTTTGEVFQLKSIQGIFKPAQLRDPLTITSTLSSPYTDDPVDGTRVWYDFAPLSREQDNKGLKRCAEERLPLIYFLQVKPRPNPEYLVFTPVFIVDWDDRRRRFLVDLSEQQLDLLTASAALRPLHPQSEIREVTKSYIMTPVQRRLHQARFRNQVLEVYRERCAVCVLRVRPLLDAAHLVPDRDPRPVIAVNEGMALCAIHHRAFDANYLRYDSDYRIHVELPRDARHGQAEDSFLLTFDGKELALPSDSSYWPVLLG